MSGLHHQQQTQGVWQNTNSPAAIIHDNHFINDLFDKGPPLTHNEQQFTTNPQHQTNFIHQYLPTTTTTTAIPTRTSPRGNKSHRYMTRQTQPPPITRAHTANLDQQLNINGTPPTVVFRPLPFYDKSCFLIEPTIMRSHGIEGKSNDASITFRLTVDQANQVAMDSDKVNIILRFCYLENSPEQDDNFPPNIVITVNGHQIILAPAISNPNRPNVPAKRPGQHVDITKHCKLCPFVDNKIDVKWYIDPTEPGKSYATSIIIGEKLGTEELLSRIKDRGFSHPDVTKKLISAGGSEDVATTNLQYSLICPLGKMKMTSPCKSTKCSHIACFDASIYLQMNEKKATWICPCCGKPAYYPDLIIDGFFMDIIQTTASDVTDVTLNPDGTWAPVLKMEQKITSKNPPPEIITISSDEE